MKKNALKLAVTTLLILVCFFAWHNFSYAATVFDVEGAQGSRGGDGFWEVPAQSAGATLISGTDTAYIDYCIHTNGGSGRVMVRISASQYLIETNYWTSAGNQQYCRTAQASSILQNIIALNSYSVDLVDTAQSWHLQSDDYIRIYNSGGYQPIKSHFNSIAVSTSTGKVSVTGYWNYSTNGNANDILQITESTNYGSQTLLNLNATGTGAFSETVSYIDSGVIVGAASTTYTLNPQITFTGILSVLGNNPFGGSGTIEDTISTTTNSTSTTSVLGGVVNNPYTVATFGTSTLPNTSDFLSFLNVPALLQTKIPFAYFFQIASGIQQGIISSSSTAIPSGNFEWHNTQNGTTTFDMFSPTTIEVYLSPTLIAMWRAFLLVVLIIDFGYNLYYRAQHHKLI